MKNKDTKLFDKRIYQRSINLGLIKKEDFQKFVSDLPDSTENAQAVDLTLLLENPIPEIQETPEKHKENSSESVETNDSY